jgi:hypothetical protein
MFEKLREQNDMQDPNCPHWAKLRDNHPDYYSRAVKMFGRRVSIAVLEFVRGRGLGSLGSEEVLLMDNPDVGKGMGRLCALDILLNNMDRLPLPVFDNREGNISNILVTSKEAIGIDQQINVITDVLGMKAYLKRVHSFAQEVTQTMPSGQHTSAISERSEAPAAELIARIEAAGVRTQDLPTCSLLEGLRKGLADIAQGWISGDLQTAIDKAELAASHQIVASQSLLEDNSWTSPKIDAAISDDEAHACANFLREVAATIADAVGPRVKW